MRKPTWTITWNDGMSVGIPEIDEDHKHFISQIHEFNKSITGRMDPAEIKNRLQLIVDDAKRHFEREERLFKERLYPDTDSHARLHAHELKTLQSIMQDFIPYGADSGWVDAGLRIKDILIQHILTDMKYANFYRNSHDSDISA